MQHLPKNLTQSMPAEVDLLIWGPTIGHQVAQWWLTEHAGAEHGQGFYLTWNHSFIDSEKVTRFTVLETPA